ncbi:unnamed protein product [Brassica rapa subsp. trilocularis]
MKRCLEYKKHLSEQEHHIWGSLREPYSLVPPDWLVAFASKLP